jgi:tetratricopeptide (TPR) repeat protein
LRFSSRFTEIRINRMNRLATAGFAGPFVVLAACFEVSACAQPALLPPKAMALNRDGVAALVAGNLEMAEARVALALEYNPRFTEAWVNLGLIDLRRGNFERARRDFVRARDLNPDLPAPHHSLGLLSEQEGHLDEAEARYRSALRVDPGFAPARVNLARLLSNRGALEDSREQYLRLTQVAPEYVQGWTGLCESLLRLDRVREAEEVLERAMQRFENCADVELLAARVLLRRNEFEQALGRLEPLTHSADPHHAAQALAWQAIARLGAGDEQGARESAKLATALAPGDALVRYSQEAIAGASSQR